MRYLGLVLFGLIAAFDCPAQVYRRVIQFSGVMAGKTPIKMTLVIQSEKIVGFYYYEKYKTKILLSGQIQDDKITLRESHDYESEFNEFRVGFIGNLKEKVFSGIWEDKAKGKTLNFEISIVADGAINELTKNSKIEGIYNNKISSDKYSSSVDLQFISDDFFCFTISNGTESGCVGYLKGLIALTNLATGVYSSNSCEEIKISISSNELTVKEKNCALHGMRCPFDGKYQKVVK
jgi:hypothetical protein